MSAGNNNSSALCPLSESTEKFSYIKPLNDNSLSLNHAVAQINQQMQYPYMLYENSVKLP